MRELQVDFNARTTDNGVSTRTRGSKLEVQALGLKNGDWIWITDDEMRVVAQIRIAHDELVAQPVWETLEEIVSSQDEGGHDD